MPSISVKLFGDRSWLFGLLGVTWILEMEHAVFRLVFLPDQRGVPSCSLVDLAEACSPTFIMCLGQVLLFYVLWELFVFLA